jgi:hypothetical protein
MGFFTGEPRLAGLCAVGEVVYTHFSGAEFDRLRQTDPQAAFDVLFTAAKLVVWLILEYEDNLENF